MRCGDFQWWSDMKFLRQAGWASVLLPLFLANASAAPDPAAGERKAAPCLVCHGAAGNSTNAIYPSLAAQTPLYIYYQLLQFRESRRVNEQMSPAAASLSDADMKDIAAYFSAQKSLGSDAKIDDARAELGKAVATRNHCGSCHLPNYAGQNHIPRLAGLQVDYLITQLRGFKTGARQDIDGTMASSAQPLSDKDIVDMAWYLASLK
jgi:cytochrome c553